MSNAVARVEREEYAPKPAAPIISSSTRIVGSLMLLALVAVGTLDYLAYLKILPGVGEIALAALMLVPVAMAALMLPVAHGFAPGPIRRQWTLFGAGMLSMAIGNVILIVLYAMTGKDPYPSVGDIFTLAGYCFFAAAFALAISAYRGLLDIRPSMIGGAIISAAAMALVYFAVIGPYVIFAPAATQSLVTRVMNTLYPVLDTLVLLAPAVTLGLILWKLGAGRLAWPWWLVVASAAILGITDTVFAYSTYVGIGRTPLIDTGYGLAPLLLGFAVLVARDLYRT